MRPRQKLQQAIRQEVRKYKAPIKIETMKTGQITDVSVFRMVPRCFGES